MSEKATLFGREGEMSKREKFGWSSIPDSPGEFEWVPKGLLLVDHTYQREKIRTAALAEIRANFSWMKLGVLLVARRPDGTLWVFDGQHRKLAADNRDDVKKLPCLIFDVERVVGEAEAFVGVNKARGPMSTTDSFRGSLVAGRETEVAVNAMIEASGYSVAKSEAPRTVKCIGSIVRAFSVDPAATRVAWRVSVEVARGAKIQEELFSGLFYLERFLTREKRGSITDRNNHTRLVAAGQQEIVAAIRKVEIMLGRGGSKTWANGIIMILNYRRKQAERIPDVFVTDGES